MLIILESIFALCAEEGWQMTKEQEMCPYCHTTTFYTGEAGKMEAEMPEKYFVDEDNEKERYVFDSYLLDKEIIADLETSDFEFYKSFKIKFCPMCGRKLARK